MKQQMELFEMKKKVDIKTGLNSNIEKVEERIKKLEGIYEKTTLNTKREIMRGKIYKTH